MIDLNKLLHISNLIHTEHNMMDMFLANYDFIFLSNTLYMYIFFFTFSAEFIDYYVYFNIFLSKLSN